MSNLERNPKTVVAFFTGSFTAHEPADALVRFASGRILMPIPETFVASRFGQVQDRFGINRMILGERTVQPHP